MIVHTHSFCLALFLLVFRYGEANLLQNADFESSNLEDNWECRGGCTMTQSPNAYTGNYSVKVTNRTKDWHGISQNLDSLQPGSIYVITIFIKLLGLNEGAVYHEFRTQLQCLDSNGQKYNQPVGRTKNVANRDWRQVGGVIRLEAGLHDCSLFFQTPAPSDYAADNASVVLIEDDPDWRTHANERIDEIRKANISITIDGAGAAEMEVQLKQNELEFPFGGRVETLMMADPNYKKYQDVFYKNFNYGFLNHKLKWKQMEPVQGVIDYETPAPAFEALQSRGYKIRCHNVFFGVKDKSPEWTYNFTPDEMKAAIRNRIKGVIAHFKGKCQQWSVNNENFHGLYYEDMTKNADITMDMFERCHAIDNETELYLNDYGIINAEDATLAAKDAAVRYKNAGVGIYGVAAEGHLNEHFDMQLIKARLDVVAEAGLPVMISAMTIKDTNATSKAHRLVDALTVAFSLPYIKQVNLFGYWDQEIGEPDAALYEGNDLTPNAAGLAYENLYHNVWRTNVNLTGSASYNIRGFKGEYTATLIQNGAVLQTQNFTLSSDGAEVIFCLD